MVQQLTVGQLADLSGVSVRTLRYYDEIGLLTPEHRSGAGYRIYTREDADRLARILVFRECGVPLNQIAAVLSADHNQQIAVIDRQLSVLDHEDNRRERQRSILNDMRKALAMGVSLNKDEIFEIFGEQDPLQYADEVAERWGDTDAYAESTRRTGSYSKETWQHIRTEAQAIEENLAELKRAGIDPKDPAVLAGLEDHRSHIDRWYYPCSVDMHRSLVDMYVQDERFTKHYDAIEPGLAQFMQQALRDPS